VTTLQVSNAVGIAYSRSPSLTISPTETVPRASLCQNFLVLPMSARNLGVRHWFLLCFCDMFVWFSTRIAGFVLGLCMYYLFSLSKDTDFVCGMFEPMLLSSSCCGEFNYCSNDVIVGLKQYEEENNNQMFETDCLLETPDQFNKTMSNTEICSCEKLTDNVKKKR